RSQCSIWESGWDSWYTSVNRRAMRSDSDASPRGEAEMCSSFVIVWLPFDLIRTQVRLASSMRTPVRMSQCWLHYSPAMSDMTDAVRKALRQVSGAAPRERADAARNRARALAAAEQLFAARGVTAVTMDDVATAAGVGKGTLYRRFKDKSGLAAALLNDRE